MDYGDKVVANGILPGNKILKTITVTGSGPDNAVPITATIILTPDVTSFGSHVKYTMYAVENSDINPSTICEESKPTTENGMYYDAMECDTTELGSPILEGTFERKKVVTHEIEVTSTTNTTYYLLIEYENDSNGQDEEQGKSFTINLGFQATYEAPSVQQTFIVDGKEVYDLPERNEKYKIQVTCSDNKIRTWNYETWSLNIEEDLEESCTCAISFEMPTVSQTYVIDGAEVTDLPEKLDYYEVAVTCSDNKPRTWNYETWSLNIEEDLEESCHCSLEFNKNMNKYLDCLADTSEELAYDGTVDNNLRYIGANPNNYVLFNNELWRIIGVMNNITDSEGNIGSHIKIIRNESIGNYYRSGSTNIINSDWAQSTLNTSILNGTYYNGLTSESKNMISSVVWNLGGCVGSLISNDYYTCERGTKVVNGFASTWTGKIGLIYPSDYGYAVGGNVRSTCLAEKESNYNLNNCYTNDWISDGSNQWLITSLSNSSREGYDIEGGRVSSKYVYNVSYAVRPALYLNTNITLSRGTGTSSDPFILQQS